MAKEKDYTDLYDRIAALRETLTAQLGSDLISNPALADALTKQIDEMLRAVTSADEKTPPPPDNGLAQLIGLGPEASDSLGENFMPVNVERYEETVASQRIMAMADLYYIFQHERIGVFRAIRKLQELFQAGTVRLSNGAGAFGLYQFDRRQVLRFTQRERHAAYCRAFGYCFQPAPQGARPNEQFNRLFTHFINHVTLYWRDKRISDVIRERAFDASFGSVAQVRRSGLDLRNNLKFSSYGHLNVLRVEVMQLLDEAFRVLGADDVRRLFGADNAWDVIEEILTRYFGERLSTSPRQRMAIAGREIIRWLAQPHILQTTRAQFEALLLQIAEHAEEWQTSAETVGLVRTRRRASGGTIVPMDERRAQRARSADARSA